jgi:lysyl-tRNA synthetase class 2
LPVVAESQEKHLPARGPDGDEPAGGRRPSRPERGRGLRRLTPAVVGWLSMLAGLAGIAGQLAAELPGRYPQLARGAHQVSAVVPVAGLATGARAAGVIAGLLLLMLSHGLRRRKHRAWQAVMALLAASVVLDLLDGRHVTLAAVSAALTAVLWWFRGEFYAVGDPRTRWRALGVLPVLLAADAVIGLAFIALSRGLAGPYSLGQRLQSVAFGLAGVPGPVRFLAQDRGDLFAATTGGLGLFTAVVTAYLFLRPPEPAGSLTEADAGRITDLLARHGARDSLGYLALRRDRGVIWSSTGKSCIRYRVACGVMLASGDPVGDPEAWPGAVHAFLAEAARHAWVPAVTGCSELAAGTWCREGGLTALQIGDEAIIDAGGYTLPDRALQGAQRARGERTAVQVRRTGDLSREEADQLARQARSWRGRLSGRGFATWPGWVGGELGDRGVLATATQDGTLRALLRFAPWGAGGLTLDLASRDRSAPPGLEELLIAEVIRRAPELGVKRISLNFAAFREALELGQRIGAGPVVRAWYKTLLFLSRWLQIEARYTFLARFRPAWAPRFLVYPATGTIPRVALAALRAEAPATSLAASLGRLAGLRHRTVRRPAR